MMESYSLVVVEEEVEGFFVFFSGAMLSTVYQSRSLSTIFCDSGREFRRQ